MQTLAAYGYWFFRPLELVVIGLVWLIVYGLLLINQNIFDCDVWYIPMVTHTYTINIADYD